MISLRKVDADENDLAGGKVGNRRRGGDRQGGADRRGAWDDTGENRVGMIAKGLAAATTDRAVLGHAAANGNRRGPPFVGKVAVDICHGRRNDRQSAGASAISDTLMQSRHHAATAVGCWKVAIRRDASSGIVPGQFAGALRYASSFSSVATVVVLPPAMRSKSFPSFTTIVASRERLR